MAGSMNRVTLIGNVGRDPESKGFSNGGKVVNLSLATSETWKDKNTGERKEKTDWHNVAIFNEGLAGVVEKFVRKGSRVMIEGKLQTRKWQDQSGQDRYATEVVLTNFDGKLLLLDGKQDGERQEKHEPARGGGGGSAFDADLDDDVPFISCDPRRENGHKVVI